MLRVRVENFQSLASVEIELTGLTAVVGPSDRGKSALVRAISAALFNLPGEYFVRTGTESATVTVGWLKGSAGDGHVVIWEKGGGKNQFTIDGAEYSKVGSKAPEPLRTFGFRDELIGARLREEGGFEGGKWMRPQIAEQFDEIYLLKEQGTFINEVLVKLSRLGVLQRASRQCGIDLRGTRSTLKVRQGDLQVATLAAERLAQAPLLKARLDALVDLDEEVNDRQRRVITLKHAIEQRAQVLRRLALSLPDIAQDRGDVVRQALADEQQIITTRAGVGRRALLAALPKALPKTKVAPDGPEIKMLGVVINRWKQLGQLMGAREMRLAIYDRAHVAQVHAQQAQVSAQQQLAAFKARMPICPLCQQPWAEAHVHVVDVEATG